jgi:tetratricopeptide repeat protein 21B
VSTPSPSRALLGNHAPSASPSASPTACLQLTACCAYCVDSSAKSADLMQAATFYCHVGEYDKARELVTEVLEREQQNVAAQTLRGWIDLLCGREAMLNKSIGYFEGAERSQDKGAVLSSLLGKAQYWQRKRTRSADEKMTNLQNSLDCLLNAYTQFQWFLPALIENTKVLMMMGKWTEAQDTAMRVLSSDERNVEALRFVVFHLLAREGQYQSAQRKLQELVELISRHEPKNAALFYSVARTVARLSGRDQGCLQLSLRMARHARELQPQNSEYTAEVGEQLLLLEQTAEAGKTFRDATRLDESNMEAHYGIIKCQILEGNLEDAEQQLEFLNEISMSVGSNAALTHLSAMIKWSKDGNKAKSVALLQETVAVHVEGLEGMEIGYEYFTTLDPDLLVQISKEFLQHCPTEPIAAGEDHDPTIDRAIEALEIVLKDVPGLIEAQLLLAKTKYITNDLDGAQKQIQQCLVLNPNYSEANVILAQIYLSQDQYKDAMGALDQALAHNFEIRDTPLYSIIKAKVLESVGDMQEACDTLQGALELPGIRAKSGGKPVGMHERATIFVSLSQALLKLNKPDEAQKVIQEAKGIFMGTPEEMSVMIVDCDVAIARGDFRAAVGRLKAVPQDSPHFVKARTTLADVYLTQRNDKKRYIQCYEELAEQAPSAQTMIALGEACLKVNEPQQAIQNFENALQFNKNDTGLRSKIGKALVATHDYERAKQYYAEALAESPSDTMLSLELASLYTRLGRRMGALAYEEAERVLEEARAALGVDDSISITNCVKVHMMLAELHKERGNMEAATDALLQARTLQARLKSEAPEVKAMGTKICITLAEYHREAAKTMTGKEEQQQRALRFYNEALKHDNANEQALLALAELHKERNELDQCQNQCVTLLRIDSTNDTATMFLAELMFLKKETESAIFHFQQLLEKRPNYYVALETLLRLLRHAGKLTEAQRYLDLAESKAARPTREAGLQFCKGLYNRFINNLNEALHCFNLARKDQRWGPPARYHMVEIYLDPNKDAFLGEQENGGTVEMNHIEDARRLLAEIVRRGRPEDKTKKDLLECYCMIATGNKQNIDMALKQFQQIMGTDQDNVPAMLGMSVAFIRLKQQPKARNMLKRICKLDYKPEMVRAVLC